MAQGSPIYIDSDFLKLWVGESISVFGSQFSPIAIQYAAKIILDAQPIQFGILSALGTLSFLLFGIPVGLYADSHRRKITMIYADVGRALILLSIPVTALLGFLSMNLFYIVAFTTGVLTVFFEICYQSYLPSLVERSKLVVANSRLQTSAATASASGPTVATTLIQIISAPMVIIGDVIGYFSSAAFLSSISKPEPPIARRKDRSAWSDVKEGLSVVFRDSRLRSIAGCTAMSNLFTSAYGAVLIPYLLGLNVSILVLGPIFSIGAIGGIIGALVSLRLSNRLGIGRSIVVFAFLFSVFQLPIYFATKDTVFLLLAPAFFGTSFGSVVYNVNQVSFRQSLVSTDLQGRMNATMRTLVWGTLPVGGLLGGVLSQAMGYHTAVGIAVAGASLAFLWVVFSPVRGIKEMPTPPDHGSSDQRQQTATAPGP
ncbi:MAG: MFS transporter [Nitrososphaerales archaeon]